jgi:ribonuclease P protein component
MKSFISIKKNREFRIVYNNGKSLANKYLIMYVLENHLEDNRFGVSVSKKVGNSVVRHRITRVIREIIRLNEINSKVKYDIVIIARKDIVDKKYDKIESAFNHLIRLHKI